MRVIILSCAMLLPSCAAASLQTRQNATSLANVPQCAQTCLSNSTATQGICSDLDIKCLCTNQEYVNSLSCCLATNCDATDQSRAILFNQQECESVGETAPGFVGCSPFSLSSFVGLGSSATTIAPSTFSSALVTTSAAPPNPLLSTISTSTDSDFGWETVTGLQPSTVSFLQRSVLTGSCTVPNFAIVTNAANSSSGTSVIDTFLYAEVGCSNLRGDCCPFPSHEFAIMPECPLDYFTTADGCCPSGYQMYPTVLGPTTPCFSVASVTLVPATTPTISGLTVITGIVFTRQYLLVDPLPPITPAKKLKRGTIIGASLGSTNALLFLILLFFWMRRRAQRRKQAEETRKSAFTVPRTQEMDEPRDITRPSELASPQSNPVTPYTVSTHHSANWPMGPGSPPPTYDGGAVIRPPPTKMTILQELPGSTYISEHHPAFEPRMSDRGTMSAPSAVSESGERRTASEPRTPGVSASEPRTPTRSPVATTTEQMHSPPLVVSPMLSSTK